MAHDGEHCKSFMGLNIFAPLSTINKNEKLLYEFIVFPESTNVKDVYMIYAHGILKLVVPKREETIMIGPSKVKIS